MATRIGGLRHVRGASILVGAQSRRAACRHAHKYSSKALASVQSSGIRVRRSLRKGEVCLPIVYRGVRHRYRHGRVKRVARLTRARLFSGTRAHARACVARKSASGGLLTSGDALSNQLTFQSLGGTGRRTQSAMPAHASAADAWQTYERSSTAAKA